PRERLRVKLRTETKDNRCSAIPGPRGGTKHHAPSPPFSCPSPCPHPRAVAATLAAVCPPFHRHRLRCPTGRCSYRITRCCTIATAASMPTLQMPRAPFAHVLRDNTDTAVRTRLRCSLLHALPIPCLRALMLLPRHRAAAPFALHSVPTLPPLRPRITMLATSLTCRFPAPALFSAPVPVLARSPHSVSVPTAAASLLWRRPRPSCIVPLRFPPRRDRLLCRRHACLRCRARLVQNSPRHSTLSVPCRRLRISMPRPQR
ncbi:hypothetical protein B0H14DRAFT_3600311, partial [Mycena olivaceomarginata]